MDITNHIQNIIPNIDSTEKVYELFRDLGYSKDKLLDPSYKRKIDEFVFAKEEREKIQDIYTVFNYDGKLQIFLVEAKSPNHLKSGPFVRYLTKHFSDRYLRFLMILTTDYKEYSFVFPEFERIEEGKHKLKLTRLNFDRTQPYHTDLLTISNIALTGDEENWRDIWKKWKDAFSVEKVTNRFFEDYKNAFFELRKTFAKQEIPVKQSHELSQQFLNRLMFLYFISKKKWLNSDPKFIKWYWERYKEERRKDSAENDLFYDKWLQVLFLEAFNNSPNKRHYLPQEIQTILADAPYLNGGLFKSNELDELRFHISDRLFEAVFSFFEKYNFTIREELPLDVEVAVDPQMIGYVYESLSNVAEEIYERQDLGIFYTPTVEVDFMCRRTIVEYLTNHFAGLPLQKEWIYRLLFDEDKKSVAEHISKLKLWYRLEEILDNLTVVDPACGSGAFLVGMLHVLAELYRLTYSHIKREITEFNLKKKIIGNALYGVDIMPWAVHSAELRLWLQLIIEEDIPYEQRKLFPLLPNLNLRLRVGDSLVQEIGGVSLHVRDESLSISIKRKLMSLKAEKEKYYNNDPAAKFKTDKAFLQEELRIFGEILDDKIITLYKDIQNLEGEKRKIQMDMFGESAKEEKQKSLFEEQINTAKHDIEHLRETKRKIQSPGQKPFVWDIDFAEIFGDKGGFDIVIGNPPYVRQEKIAPPNKLKAEVTLEGKREYKDKLLKSIQVHYPFVKKLDKKSDYYIYFYFHGLSLLNEKGIFSFITSNSWLDVGYGKDLQEFLLKYCHVKAIYDNEAKRSFEHADVNTVIALFGSPQISSPLSRGVRGVSNNGGIWPALKETARFVMFKKPFEEAINTKNLLAIEKADSIHKTEAYRVYPVKQETLLEEGWEKPEEDNPHPDPLPKGEGIKQEHLLPKGEGNNSYSLSLRERVGVREDLSLTKPPLPDYLLKACRDLRKNSTDAEQLLWDILRDRRLNGIKFRRQHPIGKFILDFYCHEFKLAIELDGGGHNEQQQKQYDEQRTKVLEGEGIKVLRFWNHDVLQKTEVVLEVIWNALGQHPHPDPLPKGEGARKGIKKPDSLLKEKFITGKYEGNKWGGKYLRAPDIFFTILEKGKGKLVRLGDIAEVRRGFTTGCNEFFYLPSKYFDIRKDGKYYELIPKDKDQPEGIRIEEEYLPFAVLSPRDVDSLHIKSSDLNKHLLLFDQKAKLSQGLNLYIKWGERQKFNQRPTCKPRDKWWSLSGRPECFLACNYLVNDYMRFYCSRKGTWFSDNFQEIHSSKSYVSLAVILNSIVSQFFINMIGRSNFGGGLLKIQTYEVSDLLSVDPSRIKLDDKYMEEVLSNFSDKCNLSIYDQCGLNPSRPIREQKPNPLPDRKALDDIVFDILGLTEDERNEVYWAVCELVANRLKKARSV